MTQAAKQFYQTLTEREQAAVRVGIFPPTMADAARKAGVTNHDFMLALLDVSGSAAGAQLLDSPLILDARTLK